MRYLRLYEQFGKKDEIFIVSMPSGEVFYVDGDLFDDMDDQGLLKYNIDYDKSFYCFSDNIKHKVESMIAWKKGTEVEEEIINDSSSGKTYLFFANDFESNLLKKLKNVLSPFKVKIKVMAKDRTLKIMYIKNENETVHQSEIYVIKNDVYTIRIYRRGEKVEEYVVPTDDMLLQRIESEVRFYFK